ncbi:hypothetical protein GQ597_03675 [Gilliamella sp. Pra-s65]|uniref:IgaA/UmoB family intracellular growth attenuator n=1 Tax=unclassified Gilliamella TaxID=2685620 RepID=UPI0013657EC0|nr:MULTISPECIES: IgaA/UmoB family intracellular growth attenuator [unclassified Gilliamella]MWN89810.1 hypothetical protein [Gilliamella sp. Pra-s65]MWP72982.1 hypothetical protein [Gilliamella sp. Pra-s52]
MDTISTLKIILLLITLLSCLIGLGKWSDFKSERKQNKRNLEEFINNRQTTRRLTAEELELITPYLNNKKLVKPYKLRSSLVDSEVSIIEGACIRHSFYTNSEETDFYYEIDGIEALFPYNLQLFSLSHNVAEVVFTSNYAIVISFNGYSLDTLADFGATPNKKNSLYSLSPSSSELTRPIKEEELQLLEPYLNNPTMVGHYEHSSTLVSSDVSIIVGSCIAINHSNNSNDPIYTYQIGDIVVFFPYDMERYVEDINIVQVVVTEHYALVVKINQYDLKTAKQKQLQQQRQKQQNKKTYFEPAWKSKKEEILPEQNLTDTNDSIIRIDKKDIELKPKVSYEIVEQRQETPIESSNRSKKNNGIFAAVFLALTVIIYIKYWYTFDSWLPLFIALSLIVSIFFYLRKAQPYTLDVSRIKTKIRYKDDIKNRIIVSDDLTLTYPAYWAPFLPCKLNEDVDIDAIVNKEKLLRYGNLLSISREIEEFGPPKFIMRNLILFVTAFLLSIMIFKMVDITDNLQLANYPFDSNVSIWNIKDAESLKNSPIKKGDFINLKLNGASCNAESNLYLEHCDKVFINQQVTNNGEETIFDNDLINALYNDDLIETVRDDSVKQLEKKINAERNKKHQYYSQIEPLTKLLHIDRLILTIDESCQLFEEDKCSRIKQTLINTIKPIDSPIEQWSELVEYSKKNTNHEEIIFNSTLEPLEQQIKNLKKSVTFYYLNKSNISLTNYQQSPQSVGLKLTNAQEIKITQLDGEDTGLLQIYKNALLGKGGRVKTSGLVTQVDYQNDNTVSNLTINDDLLYRIYQQRLLSFTSPIFIGVAIFIITVLTALSNGIIICYKLIANNKRKDNIIKAYENRIK